MLQLRRRHHNYGNPFATSHAAAIVLLCVGCTNNAAGGGTSGSGGTNGTGGMIGTGGKSGTDGAAQSSGGQSGGGGGALAGQSGGSGTGGAAGASGAPPPSCAPGGSGLNTCGPNGNESCCTSLLVDGGTFYRTYSSSSSGAANNKADPATVSSFRLDKYEVTVGRFRQYVSYLVGGGSPPASGSGKHTHLNSGKGLVDSARSGSYETGWDSSWNGNIQSGSSAAATWSKNLGCSAYATWTAAAGNNEMLPLTCLDWYEAHAFCIWDGGFLPSEAEWTYAAAGGDELRMFPWGAADPGMASQYAIYDCYYPNGTGGNCTSLSNVAKVGITSLGAGRWGQLDLAGSVWEWNLDEYASYVSPCTDGAYLTGATNRVLPGGGFHTGLMPYLLSENRDMVSYATTYRGDYGVGVRCARAP